MGLCARWSSSPRRRRDPPPPRRRPPSSLPGHARHPCGGQTGAAEEEIVPGLIAALMCPRRIAPTHAHTRWGTPARTHGGVEPTSIDTQPPPGVAIGGPGSRREPQIMCHACCDPERGPTREVDTRPDEPTVDAHCHCHGTAPSEPQHRARGHLPRTSQGRREMRARVRERGVWCVQETERPERAHL